MVRLVLGRLRWLKVLLLGVPLVDWWSCNSGVGNDAAASCNANVRRRNNSSVEALEVLGLLCDEP